MKKISPPLIVCILKRVVKNFQMQMISDLAKARQCIQQGQVIVYPTEAVYGLGCDPFNQQAVEKLLALKRRSNANGFIVLISNWSQLMPLIDKVPESRLDAVRASWPGPVTWIFPKATAIPAWVTGQYQSIAIRMSAHPIAQQLCTEGPVISTSANISGHPPAIDLAGVRSQFPVGIDALITGPLGNESSPSCIYDVLSGVRLR